MIDGGDCSGRSDRLEDLKSMVVAAGDWRR